MMMLAQMVSQVGQQLTGSLQGLGNKPGVSGPAVPASDLSGLGDPGLGSGGGGGGGDAGGAGSSQDFTPTPIAADTANLASATTSGKPPTSVLEPESAANAAAAKPGTAGSPMMPYMPPMGGMRGAQGKDRDRVVAWHPDRLMYVDDTQYSDQTIGEQPTIAPTVTPAAGQPVDPRNTGGSA
jgi:hypothetical protein